MSPNAILGGIRYSITSVKETGPADASVMDRRTEVIANNQYIRYNEGLDYPSQIIFPG